MGLDSWLKETSDRQRLFLAGLDTFHEQVVTGMRQLSARVESAHQRADDREPDRIFRARQTLDVQAVLGKLDARNLASLSRRELRAMPGLWREVGLERMEWFLTQNPESWPRLVRQRLRDWSLYEDGSQQVAWARLAGRCPTDSRSLRGNLPLSIEGVLGREGPGLLATHWKDRPLLEVIETLRGAGVKPNTAYAGHVVAEYLLRRVQARWDVSESLAFLLDDSRGRAWLPHVATEGTVSSVPLVARVAVVAAALDCRARGQISAGVRGRLEERLVSRDSVFGDPRLKTLTEAWTQVRQRAKEAFDDFLAALIQQDLEFFFERAMREQDRRRFWLRYLGSIRRTTCWLDSMTYDELFRKVATLPPEQQAAFRRARRLSKGRVSAFCLWFESYVVVEFSDTGNAAFIYRHANLEQKLRGEEAESASDLNDGLSGGFASRRLIHGGQWQTRFQLALLELGIEWDRPAQKRTR
ncbi:EH signature domain-containing protein [Archangium lipolyticum]|uniref:EH signature domain-containing protein n=1 Tax=Archangium lipolyticum TaxID=2970465 RepID=UPI00214A4446|nr:EH signature domain-containing protein [Archangium lipolyticum]